METYSCSYYRVTYEIRPSGAPLETHGPVREIRSGGHWTELGKQLPPKQRRAMLHADGEIKSGKAGTGAFELRRGKCEVCGEPFVGPPKQRKCDKCR